MNSVDESARFWDKQARSYDRRAAQADLTHRRTVEHTERRLQGSDIVLDLGCGIGTLTCDLAGSVGEILALDISSQMIEVGRQRAAEQNVENVRFVQATVFDERFEPASFDVVLAFSVLHLLRDAHRTVRRIHELLRPDGRFISLTPCLGERRTLAGMFISLASKTGVVPYVNTLRFSDLEGIVARGGFQIVEARALSRKPPTRFVVAEKSRIK